MITQEEFQRHRIIRGNMVEHWLENRMITDELLFMIENVAHKRIVETSIEVPAR